MRQNAWILAAREGARIIAYAVFDRLDNPALGLKRVRLVDFQCIRGSEEVLSSALDWMLRECREKGIHLLDVTGCWLDRPDLPHIPAPYHRDLVSWSYYYKANSPELRTTLKDPAAWVPTSFDGDASL